MRSMFAPLVATLGGALLVGCGGDGGPEEAPGGTTWYADIKPVLGEHCVRCHDGKGLGPGDFSDYGSAKAYAQLMLQKIDAGEMPPPAADPACHEYIGWERMVLEPEKRDLLEDWIDGEYVEGDPATEPADTSAQIPTLSRRDLELRTAGSYTPRFSEGNEYRCFLLDADTANGLWIGGFEPIIDNASISHHTVFFADPTGTAAQYIEDPATQSWDCPSVSPDSDWWMLHAWAPGNNPVEFPAGYAMEIPPGAQLVLQMHYFESGPDAATVQEDPGYWFKLEEPPEDYDKTMYFIGPGPSDFTIPAGDPSYTVSETYEMAELVGDVPLTISIWGMFPHLHVLGKSYDFYATLADGTESCVSRADAYDFANQPTYWFEEPVEVPPDASFTVSCTWDNSAENPAQLVSPPVDVTYGENTNQEMCFALLYGTVKL